jgi:hypothetical protein
MQASRTVEGLEYDPSLIDEQTLQRWAAFKLPPKLRSMSTEDVSWLRSAMRSKAFLSNDAAAFYDDAAVQAAVQEAVAFVQAEPGFEPPARGLRGGASVADDVHAAMKAALLAPSVDARVAAADFQMLERVHLEVDAVGVLECRVDGKTLLRANTHTTRGRTTQVVLQVAIVFLDLITVVMAAAGIMAEQGKELAKRFVQFTSRIEGWFMRMMEQFWARLSGLLKKVRLFKTGGESAKWVVAVKAAARDVAHAIVAVVAWAKRAKKFDELKSAASSAIGLMFNSGWKKFKAACQLVASLILLCVSAGTSLVLKIILLIAGLVSLVLDSIDLYDMTHAPG